MNCHKMKNEEDMTLEICLFHNVWNKIKIKDTAEKYDNVRKMNAVS
jgi:hypothetical protein